MKKKESRQHYIDFYVAILELISTYAKRLTSDA